MRTRSVVCVVLWSLLLAVTTSAQSVQFEDVPAGVFFGIGDFFISSGVTVSIEEFFVQGSPWPGHTATIADAVSSPFGTGQAAYVDPARLRFHFPSPQTRLFLRFAEFFRGVNLEINGDLHEAEHFADFHGQTIGGVRIVVHQRGPTSCGILELHGRINSLSIGGFEVFLDGVGTLAASTLFYFVDMTEDPGRIRSFDPATASSQTEFTRPSGGFITGFALAPWDPSTVYFVNAVNGFDVYEASLGIGTPVETSIYHHSMYIRDIAFDGAGDLYFSEASGGGADGKIWKLQGSQAVHAYTIKLSEVGGYWAGEFDFGPGGHLYLSMGNISGAGVYRLNTQSLAVERVYDAPCGTGTGGIAFGSDNRLYLTFRNRWIGQHDLGNEWALTHLGKPLQVISDIAFPPAKPAALPPSGAYVFFEGIAATPLSKIDPTSGLVTYTDWLSKQEMVNAPFGGTIRLRFHSSPELPKPSAKYYRILYRHDAQTEWHEFNSPIKVNYLVNVPNAFPKKLPYVLGPHSIKTASGSLLLYEFRPASPPAGYWPKIPYLSDEYRGVLDTVAEKLDPGKYTIRLEVYDSSGVPAAPGPGGAFSFLVTAPSGQYVAPAGPQLVTDPSTKTKGLEFYVHIDNRHCTATIAPPTIGLKTADSCGFLRYASLSADVVRIAWHAKHPGGYARYSFNVVRASDSVFHVKNEVGTAPWSFFKDNGVSALLSGCAEAAFAAHLYVYAKATEGHGYRIPHYDASALRAFAIAPN